MTHDGPRAGLVSAPSADWLEARFTDLPIPRDFTLLADESFVFLQGSLRSADLQYAGGETVSQLIRFYQESMPANGWRFVRMTGVRMKTLSYLKGNEICEIIIERHPLGEKHEAERERMGARGQEGRWGLDRGRDKLTHLHIQLNER